MSLSQRWVRLGEVAAVSAGQPAPQESDAFGREGLPFIRAGSLGGLVSGATETACERVTEASATKNGLRRVEAGAVLFAKSGMSAKVGHVYRLSQPAYVVSHLAIVSPGPELDSAYLQRWLEKHPPSRIIPNDSYPSINLGAIERLDISLPPLPEQRRIAAILDKVEAILHKREKQWQLTHHLAQSLFTLCFGDLVTNPRRWPARRVDDVASVQGGLQVTPRRSTNPIAVPYLRVANVFGDRLDLREVKLLRVTAAELRRSSLAPADILVVEGHGNPDEVGRAAVWSGEIDPCVHQNHLIRVRVDPAVAEATYVSAFLNSVSGRRQLRRLGKTTSGLNTLSTANVSSVVIPLPPLSAQRRYVDLMRCLNRVKANLVKVTGAGDQLLGSVQDLLLKTPQCLVRGSSGEASLAE